MYITLGFLAVFEIEKLFMIRPGQPAVNECYKSEEHGV